MTDPLDHLTDCVRRAGSQYYRLVLVVGPAGVGKTRLLTSFAEQTGHSLLNVGLVLSRRLLELSRKQRSRQAESILQDEVGRRGGPVILLDNTEILFERSLEIKPVSLLQACARNRTVVAAWTGSYTAPTLTYGTPGHPEYEVVRSPEAIILSMSQGQENRP